jgi:hypothetical protein
MADDNIHMALFTEIDPASEALERLKALGIREDEINIITGMPFSEDVFGRPRVVTRIPTYAIVGFLVGFVISLLLDFGTVVQYPLVVGGLPVYPIPTSLVLTFEVSMLGLIVVAFMGVIWESAFPSFHPKMYRPEVSDGRVALVFDCPPGLHDQVHDLMKSLGAESIHRAEAVVL